MEQEKILVVLPVKEEHKERIRNAAPDAKTTYCLEAEVTKEQVQDADIIIGNVKPEFLKDSRNLRWIQLNNAGTEGFCVPGILPKQAQLTNATGAYGMAISEHLIAMLFALQKRLDIYQNQQKDHHWEKQDPYDGYRGKPCPGDRSWRYRNDICKKNESTGRACDRYQKEPETEA